MAFILFIVSQARADGNILFQQHNSDTLPKIERPYIWAVDLLKNDQNRYTVLNRKADTTDAKASIEFTPSNIPWAVKLCGGEYMQSAMLEQMNQLGTAAVGTSAAEDGFGRYWVLFKPGYKTQGNIPVEQSVYGDCSYIEVGDERYRFDTAKAFEGPLREALVPNSPLKIKLSVNEKPSFTENSSLVPGQQKSGYEGEGGHSFFDNNDDDKQGKPYPYPMPPDDKEQQVILMLSYMASNFTWEDVLSWYNNWRDYFYSRFFPQQARNFLRETIADRFYQLYTILSGNADLAAQSSALSPVDSDSALFDEQKKNVSEIEFVTGDNGVVTPYVVIYTTANDGERIKNRIPAYLAFSNGDEDPRQGVSMQPLGQFSKLFGHAAVNREDSDIALIMAFLHMIQGKKVVWITDMTGLIPIPFTPEQFDLYRKRLKNTLSMELSEEAQVHYADQLRQLLENRVTLEVAGDGHCFFRAVGRIVHGRDITDLEVQQVRQDLRAALNRQLQPSEALDDNRLPLDNEYISTLLEYYQDDSSWGGIELLRLASQTYNRPIVAAIPTHSGKVELTRANSDGSATLIDSDQISDTSALLYHDGLNHWGVSLVNTPELQPVDGSTGRKEKGQSQSPSNSEQQRSSVGTLSNQQQGFEEEEGEFLNNQGGDGNKNPDGGFSQLAGDPIQSRLTNFEQIASIDAELTGLLQKIDKTIGEEKVHLLQAYIDQVDNILTSCRKNPERTDPVGTACDFRWLLGANIENVKTAIRVLEELQPSEEGVSTILKLLTVQNRYTGSPSQSEAGSIPFKMTNALILYAGRSHSDGSNYKNRKLIVDLVSVLYQANGSSLPDPGQLTDPLNVSFVRALDSLSSEQVGDYNIGRLKDFARSLDELFGIIKSGLNTPVKKIRKEFVSEENSTRAIREKLEAIIYHNVFAQLLQHVIIAKNLTDQHDYITRTVTSVGNDLTGLAKNVKTQLREAFKGEELKVIDGFSKKLPINHFEKLIESEFLKFYLNDDEARVYGILRSMMSAYSLGMISILNNDFLKYVNTESRGEVNKNFRQVANDYIFEINWLFRETDSGSVTYDLNEVAGHLVQIITLVKKSGDAFRGITLAETVSKYPRNLRYTKIKGIRERFTEQYLTIRPTDLSMAQDAVDSLKEIVRDEFEGTSKNDLEYFKKSFLPRNTEDSHPIENWQLDFVKAMLLQHSTKSKSEQYGTGTAAQNLDELLEREFKSPSFVGDLLLKKSRKLLKKISSGHFSESSHDAPEDSSTDEGFVSQEDNTDGQSSRSGRSRYKRLTAESLSHINSGLWQKGGYALLAGNHIHDNNAHHNKKGLLKESVPYIDTALTGVENLQDWFSVIMQSLKDAKREVNDKTLNEYINDQLNVLQDLLDKKDRSTEKGKKHIFDIVTGYFRILKLNELSELQSALDESLKHHYIRSSSILQEVDPSEPVTKISISLDVKLRKFVQPFTYALLKHITSDQFRLLVVADRNSLEFLAQIIALLNLNTKQGDYKARFYQVIELSKEQKETIDSYYIRLASEHFQKIGVLTGEKLNVMTETSEALKPEAQHTLEQIKNHKYLSAFLNNLETFWRKSKQSKNKQGVNEVISVNEFSELLIKDVASVITELLEEKAVLLRKHKTADRSSSEAAENVPLTEVVVNQPGHKTGKAADRELKAADTVLEAIDEKIKTGRFIEEYLKNIHTLLEAKNEFLMTGPDRQAAKSRWLKAAEWLENNEGTISLTYFASSFTSLYYRAFGDGLQKARYAGGGKAPFGTLVTNNVAIDYSLAAISLGSVVAQVAQAAGWNVDLKKKLAMIDHTNHFPMAMASMPVELKSRLIEYYLLKNAGQDLSFSESEGKSPYQSFTSSYDTAQDLWSMFCFKGSPLTDSLYCPGPLSYVGRSLVSPTRWLADDTIRGGIARYSENLKEKINRRIASSMIRLVGENPVKASNNMWGLSPWQQIIAIMIHFIDGPIAITEINEMGEMLKAQSKLYFAEKAIAGFFDGKPLSNYDTRRLIEMFGSESVDKMDVTPSENQSEDDYSFRKWMAYGMANAFQMGSVGAMAYDWNLYLFGPMTSVEGLVGGECDVSSAKKMPNLGDSDLECYLARFAKERKQHPERRLLNVIGMKVGSLIGSTLAVISSNAAMGKLSYDELMVGTLLAGLLKNSAMGPLERMMQLNHDITSNTIGDVVGQLDTFLKEAIESTVQRYAPVAPPALAQTGNNMVMDALAEAKGDPDRVHDLLREKLGHLEKNVGFEAMNAFADMRNSLALDAMQDVNVNQGESFVDYKNEVMGRLSKTLPSLDLKDRSQLEMAPEIIPEYARLKEATREFLEKIDQGQPLLPGVINLVRVLNTVPIPAVDHLAQSVLAPTKPEAGAVITASQKPASRRGSFWDETIKKYKVMKEKEKLEDASIAEIY